MTGRTLVGVGYRRVLHDAILAARDQIDCLELLVEHFLPLTDANRDLLRQLADRFPIVLHGVGLSLGSVRPPQPAILPAVREIAALTYAPFFGEHVSLSRAGGLDLWHLSPVPRTRDSLDAMVGRITSTQDELDLPVVLETITVPFEFAVEDYGWGDFHRTLHERTGAELLVDITNLVVNSVNGVGPAVESALGSIADVPWRQVHIVGYTVDDDGWALDSHETAIGPDVLAGFDLLLEHQRPPYVIVERDGRFGTFDEVLDDLVRIRRRVS